MSLTALMKTSSSSPNYLAVHLIKSSLKFAKEMGKSVVWAIISRGLVVERNIWHSQIFIKGQK